MSAVTWEEQGLRKALVTCEGELAQLLRSLAALCRSNSDKLDEAVGAALAYLVAMVPTRKEALLLSEVHGSIAWAASYGQSPYGDFTYVLRSALQGTALLPGSSRWQRSVHQRLVRTYGQPAAQVRLDEGRDEQARRYPRLLRAMRDAAILSHGEAESCLSLLLATHPSQRHKAPGACEAVAHFGGNQAVVRAAIRRRKLFPSTRRLSPVA